MVFQTGAIVRAAMLLVQTCSGNSHINPNYTRMQAPRKEYEEVREVRSEVSPTPEHCILVSKERESHEGISSNNINQGQHCLVQ